VQVDEYHRNETRIKDKNLMNVIMQYNSLNKCLKKLKFYSSPYFSLTKQFQKQRCPTIFIAPFRQSLARISLNIVPCGPLIEWACSRLTTESSFTAVTTALIQKHFYYIPFIKQGT
jgi:hypothetical protein